MIRDDLPLFGIIAGTKHDAGALRQQPPAWLDDVEVASVGTLSIPLTQGKFTLIDDIDLALIAGVPWHAICVPSKNHVRWYAVASVEGKRVYMHRLLMGNPPGKVDHRNGDGLDNRRSINLRVATNSGNAANALPRSACGYRGVFWDASRKCWVAEVYASHRKRFFRGRGFATPEAAARAYDIAARQCHGEFAFLNFPSDGERGVLS